VRLIKAEIETEVESHVSHGTPIGEAEAEGCLRDGFNQLKTPFMLIRPNVV